MKKTLVALAALAVMGVASAQSTVTLSGKYGFAYTDLKTVGDVRTAGLHTSDGNLKFEASESLGGYTKAGIVMDIKVRGRASVTNSSSTNLVSSPIDGRDAYVYLGGMYGTIAGGSVESSNLIQDVAAVGGAVIGLDTTDFAMNLPAPLNTLPQPVIDSAVNIDLLRYTTPPLAGFKLNLDLADSIGTPGSGSVGDTTGSPLTSFTTAVSLGVEYANGPLFVKGDYSDFSKHYAIHSIDDRFRIAGSYDFGVAKVGLGYQSKKVINTALNASATNHQYVLGVSAPVGPMLLAAEFTRNSSYDLGPVAVKAIDGMELDVIYNMSKRTTLAFAAQQVKRDGTATTGERYRVRLLHKF